MTRRAAIAAKLRQRKPWVWLCWAIGVVLLLSTPLAIVDPAIWVLVVDPDLVALFVVVGIALIRESVLSFVMGQCVTTISRITAPVTRGFTRILRR